MKVFNLRFVVFSARVMIQIVLLLAGMVGTLSATIFSPEPAEAPLVGKPLTATDLENKLVLLVFWESNPTLTANVTHEVARLNQFKNWLSDPDDFVIIGSLLSKDAKNAENAKNTEDMENTKTILCDAITESGLALSVYENWCPECVTLPERKSTPFIYFYLFNEAGKIEAEGTQEEIQNQLPNSLKKQFEARARAGFHFLPMKNVIVTDGLAHLEPYFTQGRTWATGFRLLEQLADDDENDVASEAQVLRDQLWVVIYNELERLEALAESHPGEAGYRVSLLCRNLNGLEEYDDAHETLQTMKQRHGVSEMIYVYATLETLKNQLNSGYRPLRLRRSASNVLAWLNTLSRSERYDEAIRTEARFLLRIASEKMKSL